MVRVRVKQLHFSDGNVVPIPDDGTVLLVGPNNAGKSQVLKDTLGFARDPQHVGVSLSSVDYEKRQGGDLLEWVNSSVPQIVRNGKKLFQVEGWGEVTSDDIATQWNEQNLTTLTPLFVFHADGTSRLSAGDSQRSVNFSTEVATHPVQLAYRNSSIAHEIDRESKAAFGLGVTVDRYNGSVISLRLGDRPFFDHDDGDPTDEYLTALYALPRLEEQGDGVRCYLGLVLHLAAGQHQVLLVDEPEAFLHPPQARKLGAFLARKAQSQQAFIATHSADVLQGALEGEASMTIIRVTRDGDVNHPAVLDDVAVKKLWADPLLRYSNVLDGLFHDAVVLCEGDADCRYYSAVLDQLPSTHGDQSITREPQYLFTHSGGKARMPSVVNALRAVSVPVIVVADFDVLRDAADVRKIVTSLGGDYKKYERDLHLVANALTSDEKRLRKLTLRDELTQMIDSFPKEVLDRKEAESLRAIIKAESGWDKAKSAGVQAVPQGDAYHACQRLLLELRAIGLFVVPVGELERFAPGVPGHGPSWVSAVLEQKLHETPGRDAIEFVLSIRDAVTL